MLAGDGGALYVIDGAVEVAAPRSPLEEAKALVDREAAKRDEAVQKVKSLVSHQGLLGAWTTKTVCLPEKITIQGTCRQYAMTCGKWGVPRCSGPIWRLRCTSPCARWDRTNTCLFWWPDGATTQNKCTDVPFFDPTQGTLWNKFKTEAEAGWKRANAAYEAKLREVEKKRKADPCGAKEQRACTVLERIPSCDKGLMEIKGKCKDAKGKLPFFATLEHLLKSGAKAGTKACGVAFRALPAVDFKQSDINYGAACGKEFFIGFTCSVPTLLKDLLGIPMFINQTAKKSGEKPCSTLVQPLKSVCALSKALALEETVQVIRCIIDAIRAGLFDHIRLADFDLPKVKPKVQQIPLKMCEKLGQLAFKIAKVVVLKKLNDRYNKKKPKGKSKGKEKDKEKKEQAEDGNKVIKYLLKFYNIGMVAKKVVYLTRAMEVLSGCKHIGPMLRGLRAKYEDAGRVATGKAKAAAPRVQALPLYGLKADGTLHRYGHKGHEKGTADWTAAREVASGWKAAQPAFASSGGVVYTIEPNGDLTWHRDGGYLTGTPQWTKAKVGSGWETMRRVFASSDGVVYAVKPDGDLVWYKHEGHRSGTASWNSRKVGSGWADFAHVTASTGGVIYALTANGDLFWYKHEGHRTGSASWKAGQVASGWGDVRQLVGAAGGVLYVIQQNGDLYWHRHEGHGDGSRRWKSAKVGAGWDAFTRVFAPKGP